MGVGLYVAKLASEANGSAIRVLSVPLGYSKNGIPVAKNTFSFTARDVNKT